MANIYNAVTDTLEELELEDYIEAHVDEINEGTLYHVTFQEIENGNNRIVICVEYSTAIGNLIDDDDWEPQLQEVFIVSREGIGATIAMMILELLTITLDEDYFDSDSEDESDDETLSLPRTPPVRVLRPLVPRLQLQQRNLP